MTTVAFTKGVMAADTLVTGGDGLLFHSHTPKIAMDADGVLYGVAGDYAKQCKVIEAVQRQRETKGSIVLPIPEKGDTFEILIAYPDGKLKILTPAGEEDFTGASFLAIGNGAKVAMGAMFVGASAASAVKAAIALSEGSGGAVVSIEHPPLTMPKTPELPAHPFPGRNSRDPADWQDYKPVKDIEDPERCFADNYLQKPGKPLSAEEEFDKIVREAK